MELIMRFFAGILFSCILGWCVFSMDSRESSEDPCTGYQQRYHPYINCYLLPTFVCLLPLLVLCFSGPRVAAELTISMCFTVFLHAGIYFAVLLLLIPLLRKFISARACSMLWMIPNYLYLTQHSFSELPGPAWVLRLPGGWAWILFGIWFTGFIGILVWKTISHLVFRRQVLKNSIPVTDPQILELWNTAIAYANIQKPKFKLVYSPAVTTPLSLGLFRRTMRIVLPQRSYTKEDLCLILRHECIHIGREDNSAKFFLIFCTAIGWCNPFMWIAMRKSSEDMELSCDETVLLEADEATRQKYADLLLRTAGDDRGFTTCLSSAVSTMRHRLRSIVKPRRLRSGALTVGIAFFLLYMTSGYVALAYGGTTGKDLLFRDFTPEEYALDYVHEPNEDYYIRYHVLDEQTLKEYLMRLPMEKLTGNYSFSQKEDTQNKLTLYYECPDGDIAINLFDRFVQLIPFYGEDRSFPYYYLPQGVDWEYLDTLLSPFPALSLHFTDSHGNDDLLRATLWSLSETKNGETTVLYTSQTEPSWAGRYCVTQLTMDFHPAPANDFTITVQTADGSYTLTGADLPEPNILPLADQKATYIISAAFPSEDGAVYDALFRFIFSPD